MAVADASKWFTRQGGEPATAFISGSDGVAAVTQTYTDFEAADALKAPLASPTLTGVPAAPTAAVGTNTTQVATTAYVVGQAVAKSAVGNLLIANLANGSETGTITGLGTWGGSGLPYEGTVASSTAQAKSGTRSIALTANAAFANISLADIAVTVGQTYTFSVQMRSDQASGELARLQLQWINAGGGTVDTLVSSDISITSAGWTRFILTAVAPATAVGARGFLVRTSGAVGAVAYFDEFGFWEGAGGQWALPGTPITNLGFYTDESVGRRLFQWDANNSRFQQTFGDTGWRDVTGSIAAGLAATNPTLTLYVRRHGSLVSWLLFEAAAGTATGLVDILAAVPAGFAQTPSLTSHAAYPLMNWATGTVTLESIYQSSSDMSTAGWTTIRHTGSWSYTTTDAWPTTLPGTSTGSIPA